MRRNLLKKTIAAAFASFTFACTAQAQDAVIQAGYVLDVPGEGYLTNQTIPVEGAA